MTSVVVALGVLLLLAMWTAFAFARLWLTAEDAALYFERRYLDACRELGARVVQSDRVDEQDERPEWL